MKTNKPFWLQGPAGQIECVLESDVSEISDVLEVAAIQRPFRQLVIIAHPHPLMEGTMHNKVVHSLARYFRSAFNNHHAAVRFNFRGVGGSEGAYDHAVGEVADLLAVYDGLVERGFLVPNLASSETCQCWIAGFSFGAYVALKASAELVARGTPPAGALLVAPSIAKMPFNAVAANTSEPSLHEMPDHLPVVVVQGEQDEVVSAQDTFEWFESLSDQIPDNKQLFKIPQAGHFFHRQLNTLSEPVQVCVLKGSL